MLEKLYVSSYEAHNQPLGFLRTLFIFVLAISMAILLVSSLVLYANDGFSAAFTLDTVLFVNFYSGLATISLLTFLFFRYRNHRIKSTQYLKSIGLDFDTNVKLIDLAHTAVDLNYQDASSEVKKYLHNLVNINFSDTKSMKAYYYLVQDKCPDFHWTMRKIFSKVQYYEDIKSFTN